MNYIRDGKRIMYLGILLCGVSSLSGCKLVRDVDVGKVNIATPTPTEDVKQPVNPTETVSPTQLPIVTMEPTENPVTIVVENGPVLNEEQILKYFYSSDKETLMEEGYLEEDWYGEHKLGFRCDKNGVQLSYVSEYNLDAGDSRNMLHMDNMGYGGAATAYGSVCEVGNIGTSKFYESFPEIDLESCTRTEAIDACAPFAQICGYGNAQVKAYAVTEEYLKTYAASFYYGPGIEYYISAPKPDYEYISQNDIDIARKNGNEQLAKELESKPDYDECETVEWNKEHEAYIIVYNQVLNGLVVEDNEYDMYCVYVPLYDSIIYTGVSQPLVAVEGKEETELMTEDEAMVIVIRHLGIESLEDITITGISMVYDVEYGKVNPNLDEWTIDPCWRIDYVLSENLLQRPEYQTDKYTGTVVVNAIDERILS